MRTNLKPIANAGKIFGDHIFETVMGSILANFIADVIVYWLQQILDYLHQAFVKAKSALIKNGLYCFTNLSGTCCQFFRKLIRLQ